MAVTHQQHGFRAGFQREACAKVKFIDAFILKTQVAVVRPCMEPLVERCDCR